MLLLVLALFGIASPARAQEPVLKKLSEAMLYPGNGHYYQLVEDFRPSPQGVMWHEARASAEKMTGPARRQGRLAIIDDADLYSWILQNIDLRSRYFEGATWIGLRYWCRFRKLTLSDSRDYSPRAFAAWDTPWHRQDGINCETQLASTFPYMGVYIAGSSTQRWQATGFKKRFPYYLVEYPPPRQETAADTATDSGAEPK